MVDRSVEQIMALRQLQQRLRQEQLAFDPGDPQYADYQTRLNAIQAKNNAIQSQIRLQSQVQSRQVRPLPPVRKA